MNKRKPLIAVGSCGYSLSTCTSSFHICGAPLVHLLIMLTWQALVSIPDRCLLPAGLNFSGAYLLDGNDRKSERLGMLIELMDDFDIVLLNEVHIFLGHRPCIMHNLLCMQRLCLAMLRHVLWNNQHNILVG